jgi:hypothetical protein
MTAIEARQSSLPTAAEVVVAEPRPEGDLQRTAVRGALIGCIGAVTIVTAVVAANGGGVASIGAGAMVAGFDGIPFGAMMGTMVHYLKHPEP